MIRRRRDRFSRQPFTWFVLIEPLPETLKTIQGFYDDLVAAPRMAAEFGDADSPFYGREVTPENIRVGFEFGLEGFSLYLWPRFDQIDYYDESYEFGGGQFVALVEEEGGPPAYAEMKKVVDYLANPIRDKVGYIDYEPVKEYCRSGRGYVVVAEDTIPRKPLRAETKLMGLLTPDDFLQRPGILRPSEEVTRLISDSILKKLRDGHPAQSPPGPDSEGVCILCGKKTGAGAYVTESGKYICPACWGGEGP